MIRLRFLPAAEAEYVNQILYYSAIRPRLGVRLEQSVTATIGQALAHPGRGAPRSRNTRRWLVKGFPFGVVYRASEVELLVVAVANLRRKPDYWAGRLT